MLEPCVGSVLYVRALRQRATPKDTPFVSLVHDNIT